MSPRAERSSLHDHNHALLSHFDPPAMCLEADTSNQVAEVGTAVLTHVDCSIHQLNVGFEIDAFFTQVLTMSCRDHCKLIGTDWSETVCDCCVRN